jgi:hypothetical protein
MWILGTAVMWSIHMIATQKIHEPMNGSKVSSTAFRIQERLYLMWRTFVKAIRFSASSSD